MSRKPIAAGNWKMNGLLASLDEIKIVCEETRKIETEMSCEVLICPPSTLLFKGAEESANSPVNIGAQNCHDKKSGAHTGDISAEMIKETGATHVIVGHSERRTDHKETSEQINAKAIAAIEAGLTPIICVGEPLEVRKSGAVESYIGDQIEKSVPNIATSDSIVIAYEPIWAIGTGEIPTAEDITAVHKHIRSVLNLREDFDGDSVRILYGGSVKASNASHLMGADHVDGCLVGGASLKAADFMGIIDAAYKKEPHTV